MLWILASTVGCSDDGVPQGGGDTTDNGSGTAGAVTAADDATAEQPSTVGDSAADDGGESGVGPLDGTSGDAPGTPQGTAGCGMAYTGMPVTDGSIDVDGVERTFVLSVPEGYDPDVPTALVFAWHGLGGNGQLARLYFGVEASSAGQAIFVYPDALPLRSMGGAIGWELADGGRDVLFFDALLEQMSNTMCIDEARIFSTGHSFGGYMTNALGCFRSDVLRATGSVAGGPAFGTCEAGLVAAWMTHGTMDGVVPFEQGQAARDAVEARNGCSMDSAAVDPEPCITYDGCDPDYPLTWCPHDLTDMDGHLWPPFAADGIWSFFAAQGVPASP